MMRAARPSDRTLSMARASPVRPPRVFQASGELIDLSEPLVPVDAPLPVVAQLAFLADVLDRLNCLGDLGVVYGRARVGHALLACAPGRGWRVGGRSAGVASSVPAAAGVPAPRLDRRTRVDQFVVISAGRDRFAWISAASSNLHAVKGDPTDRAMED
jgi:hypothetical protein